MLPFFFFKDCLKKQFFLYFVFIKSLKMTSKTKILFSYFARHKMHFILGVFSLFITDVFQQIRPKIIGNAIDSLKEPVMGYALGWWIIFFTGALILENFFRFWWRYYIVGGARLAEKDLLNDYFSRLLVLDQTFYNRMPTGDLMARATNDISSVRALIGEGTLIICDTLFVASFSLFFMIRLSPILTLYSLLPLPILGLILMYLIRKVHRCYDDVQAQFSTVTARAQENLSGVRVIKAHALEEYETSEFDRITKDYVNKFMRLTRFESGVEPLIRLIAGVGVVIVLFAGGRFVIQDKLTIGQFVQFFLYLMGLVWPVIAIGWSATLIQKGMTSLERIREVMETIPKIKNSEDSKNNSEYLLKGDIEFKDVYFKYKDDLPYALKGISLTIPEGATVGVVGPTGSGKTSLLNLIPRLFDAEKGEILIGGKNIKTIPVDKLRLQIGMVPQEPFLFSENIVQNLRPETPQANESDVGDALRIANIEEEINSFPQGISTIVGERGLRLSGGQKQRVTLARAVARTPSILILDDALSSVDARTENSILKNLKDFMKERTSIIIAHRISTVKDADFIIVIQDGQITEKGTHDDLLQNSGFYSKLYEQQKLEQKIKDEDGNDTEVKS